ncbi:MAG: signal peptidase II [Chloroflexi bacterium]|nr:signal peptidase II [Chloroflexota bacterium]
MKLFKQNRLIFPVVAALVVLVDQFSKYLVMTSLEVGQSWDITSWLTPFFRITHVTNTGVAFGLFPGVGASFAIVPAIVSVTILIYSLSLPAEEWLMRMVLAFPLGGAIGNLVDRLRLGFVVDFIDLSFWPLHQWPIFNLADSSIVAGVVVLSLLTLWEERREQSEQGNQRIAESG